MNEEKVAIYCRLSKEDEDKINKGDDSESIQNQKLLLVDYAMAQDWSVHKIYSDDDRKGFDRERPAFNQLLKDAENGLFNIVLCKHQSRFTRDMELAERYLNREFDSWGIRFVSIVDHVDTNIKGTKKARQINSLVNEWYSEDLSNSIKRVFESKMKAGKFLGAYACYGYIKDPKDKHKLIIDDEAASVVREIFRLYLQGNGSYKISAILTERGVPTPSTYKELKGINLKTPNSGKYSTTYGVWALNTVRRILTNKMYLGHMVQGKEKKVSYKSKKVKAVPKDEHIIVENTHTAIIDEKTFYTVQSLMDKKRTVHKPTYGYKGTRDAHLFAGKLRCLDCGSNMHRGTPCRDGKTYHMRCNLSNKTKSNECSPHSIKLNKLTTIVEVRIREIINDYMSNAGNVSVVMESLNNKSTIKKDISQKERELTVIDREIENNNAYIAAAFKEKVKGLLSDEEFVDMKGTIQDEITQHKKRKVRLEEEVASLKLRFNSLGDVEGLLKKFADFEELTHEMVNEFIDYIEIGERTSKNEQEIVIHWLF